MKKIAILIVGAGKVGTAQIEKIIKDSGHLESEVVVVENTDNIKQLADELISMSVKEVQQLRDLGKIEPMHHLQKCDYKNLEKQNSQQGWKKISKYRR